MKAIRVLGWAVAVILAGVLAANLSVPEGIEAQLEPLDSAHMYWHLGRASGFVAYGLLLASLLLGLAVSSRMLDGLFTRPWVFDMHQFLSIFVLAVMLFHGLIMLPDPYAQFKAEEFLVPFASHYRPVPVGVGTIVLYGSVIVTATFYVKQHIGHRGWRAVHNVTFVLFLGAMLHGVMAGTDSQELWAQVAYLSSGLAVLFLTFYRLLASKKVARRATPVRKAAEEPLPATR